MGEEIIFPLKTMTNRINLTIGFIAVAIVATLLLLINAHQTSGLITTEQATPSNLYRYVQMFASSTNIAIIATSTVAQATSTNITAYADSSGRIDNGSVFVAGAKKVEIYLSRGGITHANTGNTVFQIQGSPDGTNWFYINKLVQSTSTTISNATEVGTWQITAATSTVNMALDLTTDSYYAIRCIVTNTTDGEAGCAAGVTY